ncbi:MAG: PDZ domain-containing protein [Thermomicrobiales bacterium]|nr:PDZ domain-containing protein [Thermomicrobiales bacterium]
MVAPVTVYTTKTCPWCDRAKEYLRANNVTFDEKDVSSDRAAAMEMIRRSGQQGVPVITTEDEVILGFDQVRLARLVERFSGPKRPALGLLAADAEQYLAKHPEEAAKYPEGIKGIYVGDVRPNSVAAASGIRRGDIIRAVANKRVRSMHGLDQLIGTLKAGESVVVSYVRDGEDRQTTFQF